MYKGVIFDLDGVIVDTAGYHFEAWKRLANSLGTDFTKEQNEQLKGVGRVESLQMILKWADIYKTEEEQAKLRIIKNDWYLELITNMNEEEILPGVAELLKQLQRNGVKIADSLPGFWVSQCNSRLDHHWNHQTQETLYGPNRKSSHQRHHRR